MQRARKDLDDFIEATQEHVNGKLYLDLYKGVITIKKRESFSSLFTPELRSVKKGGLDQRQATGAVNIYTIPYQVFGEKGR